MADVPIDDNETTLHRCGELAMSTAKIGVRNMPPCHCQRGWHGRQRMRVAMNSMSIVFGLRLSRQMLDLSVVERRVLGGPLQTGKVPELPFGTEQ